MSAQETSMIIPAEMGEEVNLGGLGVVYKLSGKDTGGAYAIVEHPLQPGALGGPLHTHTREDEVSYVLEGEVGVQVGADVFHATPGMYVRKPRGVPHAFWNAGTQPARLLEIISPAGFEGYFAEVAEVLAGGGPPDMGKLVEIAGRYGLTLQLESVPELMAKHNVRL